MKKNYKKIFYIKSLNFLLVGVNILEFLYFFGLLPGLSWTFFEEFEKKTF